MATSILQKNIHIKKGFQKSVNIKYDLSNTEFIENFIPTRASLEIIEELMLSVKENNSKRARILIGAYGKGKSHLLLVFLSLIKNNNKKAFKTLLKKIKKYKVDFYDTCNDYIKNNKKILPIIIDGSSSSLVQSFLSAMQRTLQDEDLADLMPETHFTAAVDMIDKWKKNYNQTYKTFCGLINRPVEDFVMSLKDYNTHTYEVFNELYPQLTSGSEFNPFIGLNVVDLYNDVAKKINKKGYSGIYVVYDEFSKYLEASITKASVEDIKMLQDFAESCDRSLNNQLHLMLVSHKDVSNYIDVLPKQKVDGWRGVSERFIHREIHNNFSQVYEVISSVINKDKDFFNAFYKGSKNNFESLKEDYSANLFSELNNEEMNHAYYGCYPLHPVSIFVLPRLSEKVAQNERTLFTFLSSTEKNTLSDFIKNTLDKFPLMTPDLIYDYFEPLLRKEVYTSDIHKIYKQTMEILNKIEGKILCTKIVKTISLIYMVSQFEKLPPTTDIVINTYKLSYNIEQIKEELQFLQHDKYVVYLKKSNGFLKLKNSSGVDINSEIQKKVEKIKNNQSIKNIIHSCNIDNYLYPAGYNDDYSIIRYFKVEFIESLDFLSVENWSKKISSIDSDGVIYCIISNNEEDIIKIENIVKSVIHDRIIFILPTSIYNISKNIFEFKAVTDLMNECTEDQSLFDEYGIYLEDLEELIFNFIHSYTRPELAKAKYYYNGQQKKLFRKTQLTKLISEICLKVYSKTPIINNEAINKNYLTNLSVNSRKKVINGLLETSLQPNLSLKGSGPDVSIMRSTLVKTKILCNHEIKPTISINCIEDNSLKNVLNIIYTFFLNSKVEEPSCFSKLYNTLTSAEHGIGLKKGVIPIYIATVLHSMKKHAVIKYNEKEVNISADLLTNINEKPEQYYFFLENWSEEKSNYISNLEILFEEFISSREKDFDNFSYIVKAMQRWYINLPNFTKDFKEVYVGNDRYQKIDKSALRLAKNLKSLSLNPRDFLFKVIPNIFNENNFNNELNEKITRAINFIKNYKNETINYLSNDLKQIFNSDHKDASLKAVLQDWYYNLKSTTTSHVFNNGESGVLSIINTSKNNDKDTIQKLARSITGLRIDDWTKPKISEFIDGIILVKKSVDRYDKQAIINNKESSDNEFKFIFKDKNGSKNIKSFTYLEDSENIDMLYNVITGQIEEMGTTLTNEEARSVLVKILKKYM